MRAELRVLKIQTKLHRWAGEDPHRRFDDLFNLVADPAFLLVAWDRVRGNKGARTAGVDGRTAASIAQMTGVEEFLDALRDSLKDRSFRPLPVRERMIPKAKGKLRRLGIATITGSSTLLYLSSRVRRAGGGGHGGSEGAVELAGDVPLEAASDLAGGLALGGAPGDVGLGGGAAAHPDHGDGVDGAVERAVAAAVEPVAHGAAAAGLQRAGAGQRGERGVVAASTGVGEADDGLGGGDRADAAALGEPGSEIVGD